MCKYRVLAYILLFREKINVFNSNCTRKHVCTYTSFGFLEIWGHILKEVENSWWRAVIFLIGIRNVAMFSNICSANICYVGAPFNL